MRGTLESNATRLSAELVLLGMLELYARLGTVFASRMPAAPRAQERVVELDIDRTLCKSVANGTAELVLIGARGTRITLNERHGRRGACPLA